MKKEELFELKVRGEDTPKEADFSVVVSDAMTGSTIPDGSAVYVKANADIFDGDVGIFFYKDEMLCRQFCEDSFGNIYLLTLDREKADFDITVPKGDRVICFGKVLLKKKIPLPI